MIRSIVATCAPFDSWSHLVRRRCLLILVVVVSLALLLPVSTWASDTTPPSVSAVSVSPVSVDVAAASASVTVTATVSDTGSGVSSSMSPAVVYSSPSGSYVFCTLTLVSGTTYSGTLTIPRYAAAGSWAITDIQASDNAGNSTNLYGSAITGAGLSAPLTVSDSTPIVTPPPTLLPIAASLPAGSAPNGAAPVVATPSAAPKPVSKAQYVAMLQHANASVTKLETAARQGLTQTATRARVKSLILAWARREKLLGVSFAAVRPPAKAAIANNLLSRGARVYGSELAVAANDLPTSIVALKRTLRHSKGAAMIDRALAALKAVGYSAG